MLTQWGSKVKSLLSTLLQSFFMPAPEPARTLFPPRRVEVATYYQVVSSSYIFKKNEPLENAEHYLVEELRLYKSTTHPYHEYVVARVVNHYTDSNHQATKPIFLVIERTRLKAIDESSTATDEEFLARISNTPLAGAFKDALDNYETKTDSAPGEPIPAPSPSSTKPAGSKSSSRINITSQSVFESSDSISDSLNNLTGTLAEDTAVAVSSSHFTKDRLLDTLYPKYLPLSRLACLAEVVHDEDPLYNVLCAQCYWYANLIMKVIERESREGQHKKRAKAEQTDLFRWVRFRRGTWLRIPVGSVEESLVDVISDKFQKRWHERMAQIQDAPGLRLPEQQDQEEVQERWTDIEIERRVVEAEPNEARSRDDLEREIALLRKENETLRRQTQGQTHHARGATYPPQVE